MVATELRARGNDVRFFTTSRMAGLLADRGFSCHPAPEITPRSRPASRYAGGSGRFLIDPLPEELARLRQAVAAFEPDVLVDSILPFGPRLLGEAMGIPHASISVCACPLPSRDLFPYGRGLPPPRDPVSRRLARAWSQQQKAELADEIAHWDAIRCDLGLAAEGEHPWLSVPSRDLVLIPTTPEFEYRRSDLPAHAHFIGPLLWRDSALELPPELHDAGAPDTPLIYVSQGTFMTMEYPVVRLALSALASEPVAIAVTTGKPVTERDIGPIPPNAIIAASLPLWKLFERCALAIVHGGYGTVNEAMMAGIPVIVLPLFADQPEVGQRCVQAGVGVMLEPGVCTPRQLREAVWEVMGDPRYRDHARRISAGYRARNGPVEASELLERLARAGGPVNRAPADDDAALGLLGTDAAIAPAAPRASNVVEDRSHAPRAES